MSSLVALGLVYFSAPFLDVEEIAALCWRVHGLNCRDSGCNESLGGIVAVWSSPSMELSEASRLAPSKSLNFGRLALADFLRQAGVQLGGAESVPTLIWTR